MVKRCQWGLCNSDSRYPERLIGGVEFIPFPQPKRNLETCKRWIKACSRPHEQLNISVVDGNYHLYVCTKSVGNRQVEEVITSIFHTLLFHRSWGKFCFKGEGKYSIGTVHFVDVDCDFIDLTYVRCASIELDDILKQEVRSFCQTLRANRGLQTGQISLEFYQKKKTRWPFSTESIPWEVWTLKIKIIDFTSEQEQQKWKETLNMQLTEKLVYIAEAMNKQDYVPEIPNHPELDLVFDINIPDVQPYLFKISHQTCDSNTASVGTVMRRFMKDTFAL